MSLEVARAGPPAGKSEVGPAAARRAAPATAARRRRSIASPLLLGLLVTLSLPGVPYYLAPLGERMRHPLHPWLKPSGYVGQSAGLLALAMFLFLWLYPMRKRVRWLRFGRLPRWLDVHIVVGLGVPIVGGIHASWRFTGLIGLGYLAMLIVSLSGIVGRFLYMRIPRSREGLELSREQVETSRRDAIREIAARLGLDEAAVAADLDEALGLGRPRGMGSALLALVVSDLVCWRAVRRLRRHWRSRAARGSRKEIRGLGRMIRREVALTQQVALLDATRRLFRFWHVAHLPVAITALGAVLIHVAVVVALGVTWLW